MTILEAEDRGTGTPQGVVLAVVGPSQDAVAVGKDAEALRTARMYNLGSLVSLARWTIAQKVNNNYFSSDASNSQKIIYLGIKTSGLKIHGRHTSA